MEWEYFFSEQIETHTSAAPSWLSKSLRNDICVVAMTLAALFCYFCTFSLRSVRVCGDSCYWSLRYLSMYVNIYSKDKQPHMEKQYERNVSVLSIHIITGWYLSLKECFLSCVVVFPSKTGSLCGIFFLSQQEIENHLYLFSYLFVNNSSIYVFFNSIFHEKIMYVGLL